MRTCPHNQQAKGRRPAPAPVLVPVSCRFAGQRSRHQPPDGLSGSHSVLSMWGQQTPTLVPPLMAHSWYNSHRSHSGQGDVETCAVWASTRRGRSSPAVSSSARWRQPVHPALVSACCGLFFCLSDGWSGTGLTSVDLYSALCADPPFHTRFNPLSISSRLRHALCAPSPLPSQQTDPNYLLLDPSLPKSATHAPITASLVRTL